MGCCTERAPGIFYTEKGTKKQVKSEVKKFETAPSLTCVKSSFYEVWDGKEEEYSTEK